MLRALNNYYALDVCTRLLTLYTTQYISKNKNLDGSSDADRAKSLYGIITSDVQVRAPIRILSAALHEGGVDAQHIVRYRVAYRPECTDLLFPRDFGVVRSSSFHLFFVTPAPSVLFKTHINTNLNLSSAPDSQRRRHIMVVCTAPRLHHPRRGCSQVLAAKDARPARHILYLASTVHHRGIGCCSTKVGAEAVPLLLRNWRSASYRGWALGLVDEGCGGAIWLRGRLYVMMCSMFSLYRLYGEEAWSCDPSE